MALFVVTAAAAIGVTPSVLRALRRVRAPAARASLARVAGLPTWLVVPAAVMGAVAEDALAWVRGFAAMEARSGAAWLAAGIVMLVDVAARAPLARPDVALATGLACGTLAALAARQRRGVDVIGA